MSLLRSIASDFVEKRLWPVAVLLGGGLLAVLAYVALSGGSGSAPTPVASTPVPAAGPAVSAAPGDPNQAVSETTFGAKFQRQAGAHDPFVPLGAGTSPAGTGAAATTGGTTSPAVPKTVPGGSSGGSAGGPSISTPATPLPSVPTPPSGTPSQPSSTPSTGGAKPGPAPSATPTLSAHPVDVRFGTVPTANTANGVVPQGPPVLTDHPNLKRLSPLPGTKNAIVVYMGVRADGKTATFALMHEAILSGDGTCQPSELNCKLLDLKPGQKETLDYVQQNLSVVRYELDLVAVSTARMAQSAAVRFFHTESTVGRDLLKKDFPPEVGTLTYDYGSGALKVTAAAAAAATRAVHALDNVSATGTKGSPAYAPPLPHAGSPVVQPGWLGALLHAL